jgi:predicted permease
MRKTISLMIVDLKMWFRQPKLLLMSVAPLLILSIFAGFFWRKRKFFRGDCDGR